MNPEKPTVDRYVCAPIIFALFLYKKLLSPLLGDVCRFHPSCSEYAREAFQKRNFFQACRLTIWRLVKCNPFHPGGYDPLEPDEDAPHGRT